MFLLSASPITSLLALSAIVKHIVMFDFKRHVSDADIARIQLALLDLPKAIPSIQSYELGKDLSLADNNRRLCWTATFKTAAAYQAYAEHPAHVAFVQDLLRPMLKRNSRAAIQYEQHVRKEKVVPMVQPKATTTTPTSSRWVMVFREALKLFVFGMLLLAVLEMGWLDQLASRDWW